MAKNEVAVKETNALALAGDFEQDAQSGFENMSQDDFALPFLKLLTNTSPEVGEVDGALPGMVLNSVTGQLYDGKKGLMVLPVAYVRQYIEWAPRGSWHWCTDEYLSGNVRYFKPHAPRTGRQQGLSR
jgi:hypothetical protein